MFNSYENIDRTIYSNLTKVNEKEDMKICIKE